MSRYICCGCGTQYGDAEDPPAACRICTDDRQYVAWAGQRWTTMTNRPVTSRSASNPMLMGSASKLLVASQYPSGRSSCRAWRAKTLWDCISLVTSDAVRHLERLGGVARIAISHPHFYSSMVEWSDAFGGIPIFIHDADREWVSRKWPHIVSWQGDGFELRPGVRLIHCPGHFPGSTVLHWTDGPSGARRWSSPEGARASVDASFERYLAAVGQA